MITITTASPPDYVETTRHTRVVAVQQAERIVEDINDDDAAPAQCTIPFANPNVGITRIDVTNLNPLHILPITSSRPPNVRNTTIFFNGIAKPNPGPAAAAFTVVAAGPDGNAHVVLQRSRFYPRATSPQAESIACLAAMRHAERMLQQNPGQPINVVGASQNTYNNVLGTSTTQDRKLRPHLTIARSIYMATSGYLTLCLMNREHSNPADKDRDQALREGRGNAEQHGDNHLFADIDASDVPAQPPVSHQRPAASISNTLESDTTPSQSRLPSLLRCTATRVATTFPIIVSPFGVKSFIISSPGSRMPPAKRKRTS